MSFHAWLTCGFGSTGASSGVGTEGIRQLTIFFILVLFWLYDSLCQILFSGLDCRVPRHIADENPKYSVNPITATIVTS